MTQAVRTLLVVDVSLRVPQQLVAIKLAAEDEAH